ncbi:phospholipase B-like 1 isoform X2 [Carettochelys insculpta]|uniref:phospholipase B-like 1 isoform X2 n=1 Tax=Carettochelys insculpta TaxID=44489 RepID=UPI003EBF4158
MVITHRSTEFSFPEVGTSPGRPLHHASQCEVQDILLLPEPKSRLLGRRLQHLLVWPVAVRLPTDTARPPNAVENSVGLSISYPGGPSLGSTTLVLDPLGDVHSRPGDAPAAPGPADTEGGETAAPQSPSAASHSMEAPWLRPVELACSQPVREVLLNSRKPSTRVAYVAKWKRFTIWATQKGMSPERPNTMCPRLLAGSKPDGVVSILPKGAPGRYFGISLRGQEVLGLLRPGGKKVHEGKGKSQTTGLGPLPTWDLNLVLSKLMAPPFEPLASCSMLFLTYKVAFLVAITSARRVSELRALMVDPIYTMFHKDKPQASPREQSLHTLDVQRALAFYMDRIKPFRKSQQLFVAVADRMKGHPGSSQRISSWITTCIRYWPSYNIPFHENIYNLSGYTEYVEKYGLDFSYELTPRAKIFRRDQGKVTDLETMKYIMRYNNYMKEPYARHNPCNTICCRGDLNPSLPMPSGCYDSKVSDFHMASVFAACAVNGPSVEDGLPVFSWKQFNGTKHQGLPEFYNFDFITVKPIL